MGANLESALMLQSNTAWCWIQHPNDTNTVLVTHWTEQISHILASGASYRVFITYIETQAMTIPKTGLWLKTESQHLFRWWIGTPVPETVITMCLISRVCFQGIMFISFCGEMWLGFQMSKLQTHHGDWYLAYTSEYRPRINGNGPCWC